MLTLSIQHNIYLDRKDRYSLHNQIDVNTVGISLPIWHRENSSSEPGKEVICNYYLKNPKEELPIQILKDGYLVYLPHKTPERNFTEISDETWRKMPQEQRELYYTSKAQQTSSASLLDVKDGGSETLMYRESNKSKSKDRFMKIVHYMNIYDIKYFEGSIK
jgi:hypothetical protein